MTIFERIALKEPRTALDILIIWDLRSLAINYGLEPRDLDEWYSEYWDGNGNVYRRVGRRVRQIHGGRVIA